MRSRLDEMITEMQEDLRHIEEYQQVSATIAKRLLINCEMVSDMMRNHLWKHKGGKNADRY